MVAEPVARAPRVEDVEAHRINHAQFQPRCPHCVVGRGVTGQHRRRDKRLRRRQRETGNSIISRDYMRMMERSKKSKRKNRLKSNEIPDFDALEDPMINDR